MRTIPMSDVRARYLDRPNPGHWFDRGSIRFFRTVLPRTAYEARNGTVYFATAETGPDNVQRFSVRCLSRDGASIRTIGPFQGYASRAEANRDARLFAETEPTRE